MAKDAYIGVEGVARKIPFPYIGVDGVSRAVKSGYVGVDAVARQFLAPEASVPVILEVEKITSNTYANETTYENEEFILLDIYPKTNGTVSVTYGDLTKTITDTSGAEEPNSQQVYFGTFNGVTDSVATPASGTLIIEGDCRGVACGHHYSDSKTFTVAICVTEINSLGSVECIPYTAFGIVSSKTALINGCEKISKVRIPKSVTTIKNYAFCGCVGIQHIEIPSSVVEIGVGAFAEIGNIDSIDLSNSNIHYKKDGSCIVEVSSNRILFGSGNVVIPSYTQIIDEYAFYGSNITNENLVIPENITIIGKSTFMRAHLNNVILPSNLKEISDYAFNSVMGLTLTILATTPPTIGTWIVTTGEEYLQSIIVPKGCGAAYKAAEGWSEYANYIVEAT